MLHFRVLNPLVLVFTDKTLQPNDCSSFVVIKFTVDTCPCDAGGDCDRVVGPGCGCGTSDNKGGGCDLQLPIIFSCDEDICDNDKCEQGNITTSGTDAPCATKDECNTDWSACYSLTGRGSSDYCDYDCPCGCLDITNQPLQGQDNTNG